MIQPDKIPKNYMELLEWMGRWRNGAMTERLGQAFFNDFGFEYKNSYEINHVYDAMNILEEGLHQKFPDFYS